MEEKEEMSTGAETEPIKVVEDTEQVVDTETKQTDPEKDNVTPVDTVPVQATTVYKKDRTLLHAFIGFIVALVLLFFTSFVFNTIAGSGKNSHMSSTNSSGSGWGTEILGTQSDYGVSVSGSDSWSLSDLFDSGSSKSSSTSSSTTFDNTAIENETYTENTETGFVLTASTPISTISADADTASYCNLRRLINDGASVSQIPSGSVRIEEMLNYFDYDYASPSEGQKLGTTMTIADCPWNSDTKLLIMGMKTEDDTITKEDGSNFVFLIDVSGSMKDSNKLPLLQQSFTSLLDNLNANDTVSIVTYAGKEEVVLDGAKVGTDYVKIKNAIDGLVASGSTNGQAGLETAYEVAHRHHIDGGNNRIIMASDGDLNVGMSNVSEIADFVEEHRNNEDTYLSVLGFGTGNYSDANMETIADKGNGTYYYIDGIGEAQRVFSTELSKTMHTVADDVKVQIEFNSAYIKAYRQIGYENRSLAAEDFNDDTVDAAELGSGSEITVAYEIVLPDSKMELPSVDSKYSSQGENNGEWAELRLRYKEPGKDESTEEVHSITEDAKTDNPSDDFKFAASVIEFGMSLTDSQYKGTSCVDKVKDDLRKMDLSGNSTRREFERLVNRIQQ